MIYESRVQDIVINGTSASSYSTQYDLSNTSSNDWYLVIRDPEINSGFLNVSALLKTLNNYKFYYY